MKKHHLFGRKTPGPYTKIGNDLFDGAEKGIKKTGSLIGAGTGMLAEGSMNAYQAGSSLAEGAWNGATGFNEWAQENYATLDTNPNRED